jgi:uncharacterized protein
MLRPMLPRSLTSISLLIALTATLTTGGSAATLDYPEPRGYVNDFANVIDAQSRDRLNALCTELDQNAHAQIAIVTIESLRGAPIEHYATSLFNKWGIGHKDDNRGILILLALSDHKSRIEIGRGFEALFPNERVANIVADMVPDLKQQQYSRALLHCTRTIATIVAQERGVKFREVDPRSTP